MAISINHNTSVITVEQADCVLVSGTFYRLPTETVFRAAINNLLDDEDGIPLENVINHNTEVTIAGVTYARFIEVLSPYSVQFTPDSAWTVEMTESNNNLHDVAAGILVQNQVQVLTTNSAGLITVTSGSGLSAAQDTKLTRIYDLLDIIEGSLDHAEVMRLLLAEAAGSIQKTGKTHKIKSQDGAKDRIIATADETGRTVTAVDGS